MDPREEVMEMASTKRYLPAKPHGTKHTSGGTTLKVSVSKNHPKRTKPNC